MLLSVTKVGEGKLCLCVYNVPKCIKVRIVDAVIAEDSKNCYWGSICLGTVDSRLCIYLNDLINMFDRMMANAVCLITYVIKSKIVFKRFYERTGSWSVTAKELYWSGSVSDKWVDIHKVVGVSGVAYKIVIKGLLLDNG
jgi:hypothetical protein